jgi:WhiB family transcriptional regulator, redox-sensing transcriptional regulator
VNTLDSGISLHTSRIRANIAPGLTLEPEQWTAEALCAQVDSEIFFPEKGGSTREAKKICGACPVREQCLQYALDHNERFGIWGQLSERERRSLTLRSRRIGAA